jgi:hypothetical protein
MPGRLVARYETTVPPASRYRPAAPTSIADRRNARKDRAERLQGQIVEFAGVQVLIGAPAPWPAPGK